MPFLPATGSQIAMGQVRKGYTNITSVAGNNVTLSGTLGSYVGHTAGTQISLSSRFGGRFVPYNF